MIHMTPDLIRAIQDDRRQRLVDETESRRAHREIKAARRAEPRPERSVGPRSWLRALGARSTRRSDAKIARLAASWLQIDRPTAHRLARIADEINLPVGTELVPGRFSYIGLDDAHSEMVITRGTDAVTLESPATALVLRTVDLEDLVGDIPRLARLGHDAAPSTDTADVVELTPMAVGAVT